MTILQLDLQQRIGSVFNINHIITDTDFAQTNFCQVSDPLKQRAESFVQYKSHVFGLKNSNFTNASDIQERVPLSTSLDFLFGGPFYRGEVTSIEGGPGVGKTRICVKIAHEVSVSGKVLYIDADFSLQPNIFQNILLSLNLPPSEFIQLNEESLPNYSDSNSFHVALCSNSNEVFTAINLYIRNAQPDLIIVDSEISLFQSSTMKSGPGSAMLQEFAIEFKKIVQDMNCVGIVTNSLRNDTFPPQPFLGRIYASLWHQRLIVTSKAFFTSRCELVASPRFPHKKSHILIQTLAEVEEEGLPVE